MATVTTTTEVDNLSLAAEVADNLGYEFYEVRDAGDGFTLIQICTGEAISPARLLANFWTEYADITEIVPPSIVSPSVASGLTFQDCGCLNTHVGACALARADAEQTADDVLAALDRDRM